MNTDEKSNRNLTKSQKELLLWHQKCGHADMERLKKLAVWRPGANGVKVPGKLPVSKDSGVSSVASPMCVASQMAKQHHRTPNTDRPQGRKDPHDEMVIRRDNLIPGDKVSIDQYQAVIPGRQKSTFGKEKPSKKFTGGTLFVDHSTSYVYIEHQVSTGARETVRSKRRFERHCKDMGHPIKSYRADNHPFRSEVFKGEIENCHQTILL